MTRTDTAAANEFVRALVVAPGVTGTSDVPPTAGPVSRLRRH